MDYKYNFKYLKEPLSIIFSKNTFEPQNSSVISNPIPPPGSSICSYNEPALSLKNVNWYWGKISRQEANKILLGTPDGSFIVRDSENNVGDFTLTLRKGGRNKLIRITNQSGKYGFTSPFEFNTIAELINYYQSVSLSQYNPNLNTKLLYPISRYRKTDNSSLSEELIKAKYQLLKYNNLYRNDSRIYNEYCVKYNIVSREIEDAKKAINAYEKTLFMFKAQKKIHEDGHRKAEPHEIKPLQANFELFIDRYMSLCESQTQLKDKLAQHEVSRGYFENKMHKLELRLLELVKKIEKIEGWLICNGEEIQNINPPLNITLLNNGDIVECAHNDESTWFAVDCSRSMAEELLAGKKNGTFLIRPSHTGQLALSVVCNGTVNHCIIYKTLTGYGFAEPFNIYKTLKELVLHYFHNSLEEHNDSMHITLAYPGLVDH